jgi:hypothetical protein
VRCIHLPPALLRAAHQLASHRQPRVPRSGPVVFFVRTFAGEKTLSIRGAARSSRGWKAAFRPACPSSCRSAGSGAMGSRGADRRRAAETEPQGVSGPAASGLLAVRSSKLGAGHPWEDERRTEFA